MGEPNAVMELPELNEEALENLLDDKMLSLFLTEETKELIRGNFQKDKESGFKSGQFILIKEVEE